MDRIGYEQEQAQTKFVLPEVLAKKLDKVVSIQDGAFIMCAFMVEAFFRAHAPYEKAMWIADETTLSLNIRKNFRVMQMLPILPRIPATQIECIQDSIYFGSSKQSIGLQLADVCNYLLGAYLDPKRSAGVTEFAEVVRAQLVFPLSITYPAIS